MARILNYGSLNIDHVYSVPYIVRLGETISAVGFNAFPGGKGLNQSVAMARAGAAVFHAGKIGNDSGFLKKILAAEGVDCTWLKESGGMRIAFNPSPIDDTVLHMDLSMVSWLIINETEGYGLTGEKEPEKMVKNLITRYPGMAVILTLGEDGSIYCKGNSLLRQAAYRFEVKDTTAAGGSERDYEGGRKRCQHHTIRPA